MGTIRIGALSLSAIGLLLAGCAEPARQAAMVPEQIVAASASNPYRNSVSSVTGYGGEETNPMMTSEISKDDFQEALELSLKQAGFFSETGNLSLRADILTVEQPLFGFDVEVAMTVRYNLFDAGGRIRFDKTIRSVYKASFSEAFVGVERLRRANEGAARENISLFLKSIGGSAQGTGIKAVS